MKHSFLYLIIGALLITIGGLTYSLLKATDYTCSVSESNNGRIALAGGMQTSATFVFKNVQYDLCQATPGDPGYERLEKQFTLMKATHIKAASYALLNKLFFWISLPLAVCVILLPIIHHHLKSNDDDAWYWRLLTSISNPVHLPAITLLAGLSFSLYTDYKLKQTHAESLMGYIYFSADEMPDIFTRVNTELNNIDRGHNFSAIFEESVGN